MQGNEAIVQGAVKAGLEFFSGYPITPASEILQGLVKTKVKTLQVEDEISAIMSVMGASIAGAKSMTATSGPGFCLMQEAIGFGHRVEIPSVIVDVQRVGPGTGMPTRASQGDILQACFGAGGDYYPLVFYPNSAQELYEYTIHSINAAEECSSPVILLSDAYISHSFELANLKEIPIKKRAVPHFKEDDSYYHLTSLIAEHGHPKTTDRLAYRRVNHHLKEDQLRTAKNYEFYEYLPNKNSDTLAISFGAMSRAMYAFKYKFSLFRPMRIFPMLDVLKKIASNYDKIIVAEMNEGQYALLVESLLKREVKKVGLTGGEIRLSELKEALK